MPVSPSITRLLSHPGRKGLVQRLQKKGFTLIEMLVVVAIIALVAAAVTPMVFSQMMATRITSAGESMAGLLSLARQLAVSGNQEVEVRFYQYAEPATPGSTVGFRAVALVRSAGQAKGPGTGAGAGTQLGQQLSDTFFLPSGITVSGSAMMSPPLTIFTSSPDREGIIKKVQGATFRAFHFYPDGSTDFQEHAIVANRCYFTLGEERVIADGSVPKNFYAVQVDPTSGRVISYRP